MQITFNFVVVSARRGSHLDFELLGNSWQIVRRTRCAGADVAKHPAGTGQAGRVTPSGDCTVHALFLTFSAYIVFNPAF